MANPELGTKQICPTCQSKFYDLGRRPATCPKCGAQFDPEEALKTRVRTRARGPVPDYEDKEEAAPVARDPDAEDLEEADETPEIDAAANEPDPGAIDDEDAGPDAAPAAPADDLGVDFAEEGAAEEDAEDVPFLEDEEDDDTAFPDDDDLGLPEEDADR